ncbi:acid phosphatase/Vanadium-dependent haloperoxidase [Mollisia scopiformis]|uniref:Acid phosphatase/Vanadium-dependent haloperoxidase n=1 Tax=Mollisia scopiformis TaxID=149040 RepID=A0A194XJQ9_MOLSC|nr:acid phosphatase/Vanadium-dependent haloperoxidase [Mollisia scopiformis]KUJ20366.1 acid phosphatase/Vanadium-dependent haloperoxidase [Mollisia scopiformis]
MNLLRSKTRLGGRVTIALVASYVLDWIVVILAAVIGAVLSTITPNQRPFSLTNAEISFPYVETDKISTTLLVILGLVVPAVIIALVCLALVPGPTVSKSTPKGLIWRRRLWEWHTGWLGLALSCAAAFFITNGMKNLFGKPRPDLLSRCEPDVINIANYTVGGFPNALEGFNVVSAAICKQTDKSMLNDGFRSFSSGHSSFSAAGLVYLSLFLASKLAITIPFLAPNLFSRDESRFAAFPSRAEHHELQNLSPSSPKKLPASSNERLQEPSGHNDAFIAARNQAAAPPVYLLVIAVIPFFLSIYISSTRYSDFKHHGFDILFGFFIGTVTAVLAFRLYHLPISQGAGWSWGPRSKDRSFWAGIGVGNYVGTNANRVTKPRDVEAGTSGRRTTGDMGISDRIDTAV